MPKPTSTYGEETWRDLCGRVPLWMRLGGGWGVYLSADIGAPDAATVFDFFDREGDRYVCVSSAPPRPVA